MFCCSAELRCRLAPLLGPILERVSSAELDDAERTLQRVGWLKLADDFDVAAPSAELACSRAGCKSTAAKLARCGYKSVRYCAQAECQQCVCSLRLF